MLKLKLPAMAFYFHRSLSERGKSQACESSLFQVLAVVQPCCAPQTCKRTVRACTWKQATSAGSTHQRGVQPLRPGLSRGGRARGFDSEVSKHCFCLCWGFRFRDFGTSGGGGGGGLGLGFRDFGSRVSAGWCSSHWPS